MIYRGRGIKSKRRSTKHYSDDGIRIDWEVLPEKRVEFGNIIYRKHPNEIDKVEWAE